MEKIGKQPIWESSSRPLYPKCIWVEGGSYRNFILDHDISRRRQSFMALDGVPERRTLSCDGIEEDLQSLKLIGSSETKRERRESNLSDSTLQTNQRCSWTHRNSLNLVKPQLNDRFVSKKRLDEETVLSSDTGQLAQSLIKSDHGEEKVLRDEMDVSKNQLTERVLQWLDLAGRNTIVRNECEIAKRSHPKWRISTASETHRKMSINQLCTSPSHPPTQAPAPLRRTESVHHLSLTFNEENNYLPQIKSPKETTGANEKTALRFGEFFPTAYRCSRKFLAYRNGSSKARQTSSAKPDSGRKSFRSKAKRMESIENQYQSMIQRQILENNCNTQLAKRQLHIFMPNLPKKSMIATLSTGNNGDCDSCLSTILSSGVAR